MSQQVSRGVLVGAGFFARFQAEAWQRIPTAKLTAVADSVPGKARQFADEFGIPRAFESAEEMFDLLRRLNAEGSTVLYVTHDMELASKASRIVTIRDGVVAA